MTALRWLWNRFKDLFFGVGNQHLELARCIAGLFSTLATFAVVWDSIVLHQAIDLGSFLMGLAALSTALWTGVAAKDWARAQVIKAKEREE